VVGSNILNLLGVLGMTAMVAPGGIPVSQSVLTSDLPFMVAVALACFPIFLSGYRIERWEGAAFLGFYVAYTVYLILRAQQSEMLAPFTTIMVWFVGPLTALVLAGVLSQEILIRRKRRIEGSRSATD
jgi:cation:H+ antiporter